MSYPGNPSLPSDVQQRIRSTFEHTLGLAEGGSRQEALLGCDFVLRMDPLFEPARRLQERLEAGNGPLPVDDLRQLANAAPPRAGAPGDPSDGDRGPKAPADSLWPDLDGLAIDLPDLPEVHPGGPPAAPPADLRGELGSLLAERRFQEIQTRAAQLPAAVTGDLELQRIVALAQERLEAGPYVSRFLLSAREALRTGNAADAGRLLEKARTLDPTHPGIAELAGPAGGSPAGATAAAAMASSGGTLYPEPEMQTQPISSVPRAAIATAAPQAPPPPPGAPPAQAQQLGAGGDSESERRIRQLLDEGQAALDGGDPQAAIDAWSRIFLIDIDHREAAQRIESARRVKAERDRQVEEAFHDGIGHLEAKDPDGARQAFERVLELQPGHLQSRELLQQLDDGIVPVPPMAATRPGLGKPLAGGGASHPTGHGDTAAAGGMGAGLPAASASGPVPIVELPADLVHGQAAESDLKEEILVPPDLDKGAARQAEPRREARAAGAAAQTGRARRLFMVVGSAVLLLALAVGWFLYQKREQWFPNSRPEEAAQPAAPNPIPRATKLHNSGKVAIALSQLRRVAPGDPHFKEAQTLIAKWQDEAAAPAAGSAAAGAPGTAGGQTAPAAGGAGAAPGAATAGGGGADPERRRALLAEAQKAFQDGSFLRAAERYEAADKLAKLEPADVSQLGVAKQKLVPIQRQLAMFRGHDWEYVLPELWRMHESDPSNKDVNRMLVDSYYDLGVRDLQHGDAPKAAQKFTEAKNLAPDDPEIKRQLLFAQTYQERSPDLLYRIYVKYLPVR